MPTSDKPQTTLEWRLAFVEQREFHEAPALTDEAIPSGFRIHASAILDEEQQALVIPVKVEVIEREDAEEEDVMARLELACVFQFKDLDAARDEEGNVKLSRSQVISALGIALSTARGVLIGRAKHPVFSRAVLPIISPRDQFDTLIRTADKPWIASE